MEILRPSANETEKKYAEKKYFGHNLVIYFNLQINDQISKIVYIYVTQFANLILLPVKAVNI